MGGAPTASRLLVELCLLRWKGFEGEALRSRPDDRFEPGASVGGQRILRSWRSSVAAVTPLKANSPIALPSPSFLTILSLQAAFNRVKLGNFAITGGAFIRDTHGVQ
jgi:hypothetical protein